MVLLSTAATVIASQAVVSGAFSLTRQAVQLGYCPRLRITYTSARAIGQIYVPAINWALMLGTIALVLGFRSSASLAAAYGIAVSATMGITTLLLAVVARERWGWSWAATAVVMGAFLAVDAAFFGANALKIAAGGWVSVVFAAAVFTVMTTWRRGRLLLADRLRDRALPDETLVASLLAHPPLRVPGTAVFMDRTPSKAPPSLLHNVRHNKVLHERVVLLTVITEPVPHVGGRWEARRLADGIHRMTIRFGFMDDPDVPAVLTGVRHDGLEFPPMETTFFLSRDTILAAARPGMAVWRERLFAFLSRNALDAAAFFRLPPNRVVEVGAQVEL
jgi:KUP system potassium uptake protein